jgi:hypothetical protein
LKPLIWTSDTEKGFESFDQCFDSWLSKATEDPNIDIYEKFKFPQIKDPNWKPHMSEILKSAQIMKEMRSFMYLEDMYNCSGMCKESLFFFQKSVNSGFPTKTCLHKVKKDLMENAVPYTVCCVLIAINTFFIFLLTTCMFYIEETRPDRFREDDSKFEFDAVAVPNTS